MVLARYHGELIASADAGGRATGRFAAAGGLFAARIGARADDFGFMFRELVGDPNNLLPTGAATVAALRALGAAMATEDADHPRPDGAISAAYTYFGQFIDHDITKTEFTGAMPGMPDAIDDAELAPLGPDDIGGALKNGKTPELGLDSPTVSSAIRRAGPKRPAASIRCAASSSSASMPT